jgi:hypothetical protein
MAPGEESSEGTYAVIRERVQDLPPDPVIATAGPVHDFVVMLSDGRRVVGHDRDREWSVYVYGDDGRLLGYGSACARSSKQASLAITLARCSAAPESEPRTALRKPNRTKGRIVLARRARGCQRSRSAS